MARKHMTAMVAKTQASSATAKRFSILVVDDSEEVLGSMKMLLARQGFVVGVANSGEKALSYVRSKKVHVMLLDFFMPGMTGEDVVRELRTFNTTTQVVLQTGYAGDKPAREMMQSLNIQGYHDKADGPDKLLVWVDAAIKMYRALVTILRYNKTLEEKVAARTRELAEKNAALEEVNEQLTENRKLLLEEAHFRQKQLLPRSKPEIAGIRIDCIYQPLEAVGGDFYNYIDLGWDRWGIVLGDVAGHGIQGAIVMSKAQAAMEIHARDSGSVEEALCKTNEDLHQAFDKATFVTMIYAILDGKQKSLTLGRAGHTYPLLYTVGGAEQPELLKDAGGLPLGTSKGAIFEKALKTQTISLAAGDGVLLYSDGIMEAQDEENEQFGLDRMLDSMGAWKPGSGKPLARMLCEEAEAFAGAKGAGDDVTVLDIRRLA